MLIIDVSNGTERRYFIIPSDSLDDLPNISSIDLGRFATAAGSDATLSSALNNAVTVCFAAGVLITTIDGEVPVEKLCVGDLILTLDEGFQPLRWIGCQALTPTDLACKPELRPIRIRAGALGAGVPRRDLVVSPHHRIFARSKIARNMFGCHEVLVAAKDLLFLDGIEVDCGPGGVDYWHLLFDKHQLIYAEGAIAESLYAGPEALKAVGAMAMRRRFPIMREAPMLFRKAAGRLARPHLKGRDARHLALKHVQKNRAMVVEF
ncbi:MAG: hypothetical protein B7X55_05575 [Rhodobacterales bacterium 34-62-10]|nr:MAG: hypothetical protein B7X55_05575 [Rhodobacterales bacterium 34-62-10]